MALLMQSCTTLNHPSNISLKLINIRDIYHFSSVLFGMHYSLPGTQNDISDDILIKFKDSNEIRETRLLLSGKHPSYNDNYSRISVPRTPMARLPRLVRTRF